MTEPQTSAWKQRSFAAFISYRHADNQVEGRQWATWLHHSLETYEVPDDLVGTTNAFGETIPARLFPVFRDEEELSADASLSAAILRALESSRHLIVICSPRAVDSPYVADEITQFKRLGKGSRIIAAIVDGEPHAAAAGRECFPAALRFEPDADGQLGAPADDPLAADFRLDNGEQGWTNPQAYRQHLEEGGLRGATVGTRVEQYSKTLELMKLKIIAGLLGVPLGVLTERDKAYRLLKERQRARALRRWLAAVTVLAVAALGGGALAWIKQQEAQQRQAETVYAMANSDFQQGASQLNSADTFPNALALLARSVRDGAHPQALQRLWVLMQQRAFWRPTSLSATVKFPPLPAPVAVPDAVRRQFQAVMLDGNRLAPNALGVSADHQRVVTAAGNGALDGVTGVRVWRADGTPITPWFKPDYAGDYYLQTIDAQLSRDGRFVVMTASPNREPQYVEVRQVSPFRRWGEHLAATGRAPQSQHAELSLVHVLRPLQRVSDPDALRILTASGKGDATVTDIHEDRNDLMARNRHATAVAAAAVDSAQEWLMSGSVDGQVLVSAIATGAALGNLIPLSATPRQIARLGKDSVVVRRADDQVEAFTLLSPWVAPEPAFNPAAVPQNRCVEWASVILNPSPEPALTEFATGLKIRPVDERAFTVVTDDRAWDGAPTRRFDKDLQTVCINAAGSAILTTTADFTTEVWDARTLNRVGQPLREFLLFGENETPDRIHALQLSPDGAQVLIHSGFWFPPNVMHHWFSVWDLKTGRPLTDRTHDVEFGGDAPIVNAASFDASGAYLLYLETQAEDTFALRGWVQLRPDPFVHTWLPKLVEALGGLAYDRQGNLGPTPDRMVRLRDLATWRPNP